MALQLKKAGVGKVYPLEGGFEAWLALHLPTEAISETDVVLSDGSELNPGNLESVKNLNSESL